LQGREVGQGKPLRKRLAVLLSIVPGPPAREHLSRDKKNGPGEKGRVLVKKRKLKRILENVMQHRFAVHKAQRRQVTRLERLRPGLQLKKKAPNRM